MTERIPSRFANNGDRTAIDLTDAQGKVSWDAGYGNDYERRIGEDPNAKAVERAKQNWLFGVLTENVKQWQDQAFPEWRGTAAGTVGIPFEKNAFVRLMSTGEVYRSLQSVPENTPVTNSAYWEIVLTNSQIRAISPMPAGGGDPAAELITSAAGVDINSAQFQTGTWQFVDAATSAANLPEAVAGLLECKAWKPVPATPSLQARVQRYHTNAGKTWTRSYNGTSWSSWEQIQQRSELAGRGYFGAPAVTDLNTAVETGFYSGLSTAANLPPDMTPSASWNLIVTKRQTGTALSHQMLFADNTTANSGAVWVRSILGTSWRSWRRISEVSDIPAPVSFPKFADIDFDTVPAGSYYMNNASFGTSTGAKPSPSGAGVLTTVVNSPYAAQTYSDYQGRFFYRGRLDATTWTAWNQSANYADIPAPKYFPVNTAINFDTITKVGTYYFDAASFASSTGTKPQNTIGGILTNESNDTFKFQTFNGVEGTIQIRGKNGADAWTAWVDPARVMGPGALPSPINLNTTHLDDALGGGHYIQTLSAEGTLARGYPESNVAGSLIVTGIGSVTVNNMGVQQRFHVYRSGRVWVRASSGLGWTPWAKEYNTENKPTATDVGALPVASYKPRTDSLNNSEGAVTTFVGDLNTLTSGTFRLIQRAGSSNNPPGTATYLYVETKSIYSTGATLQMAYPYAGGGSIYMRNYDMNSSAWTAWQTVFSTVTPPTPAQVGAVSLDGSLPMTGTLTVQNGAAGRMVSLNAAAASSCYIYGIQGGTPSWYVGNGNASNVVTLNSYVFSTTLSLNSTSIDVNKPVVQSVAQGTSAGSLTRKDYVDSGLSTKATLATNNTFTGGVNTFQADGSPLRLNAPTAGQTSYILASVAGVQNWYIGKGIPNNNDVIFNSYIHNTNLTLQAGGLTGNKAFYTAAAQPADGNSLARRDFVTSQVASVGLAQGGNGLGGASVTFSTTGKTMAIAYLKDASSGTAYPITFAIASAVQHGVKILNRGGENADKIHDLQVTVSVAGSNMTLATIAGNRCTGIWQVYTM